MAALAEAWICFREAGMPLNTLARIGIAKALLPEGCCATKNLANGSQQVFYIQTIEDTR